MKHTPGPWRAAPQPGQTVGVHTFTHCVMYGDDSLADTLTEADANLIGAAPDLLAACKLEEAYRSLKGGDGKGEADLRDTLGIGPRDHIGNAIAEVRRAAIAKAEGGAA